MKWKQISEVQTIGILKGAEAGAVVSRRIRPGEPLRFRLAPSFATRKEPT